MIKKHKLSNISWVIFFLAIIFSFVSCKRSSPPQFQKPNTVWSTYYSNNDSLYAVGYNDGSLLLFTSIDNKLFSKFSFSKEGITTCLFNKGDSLLLTTSMDSLICIYNISKKELLKHYKLERQVYSGMFLNNSKNFAVCGPDSSVYLIDYHTGKDLFKLKHDDNVNFFWFTQNDSILVSSCEDGYIYVWDFFNQKLIQKLCCHKGGVKCVYISRDDRFLVSTGADSSAIIWNFKTGSIIKKLSGHNSLVNVAMFNTDASIVASCDDEGYLLIWDTYSGRLMHKIKAHQPNMCALHFNSNGTRLITGSSDGIYKIWDTHTWRELKN